MFPRPYCWPARRGCTDHPAPARGTSYNELLNEVRKDLVVRYLSEVSRKHAEIALLLGFSGPSSFSRWFRHEFGYKVQDWTGGSAPSV